MVRSIAIGSLLLLMACAQVWGFQDLTLGPDAGEPAGPDATRPEDDAGGGDVVVDDAAEDGHSRTPLARRTPPESMLATRVRPIPAGAAPIAGPARTIAAEPSVA
jgi:hypothetical protein